MMYGVVVISADFFNLSTLIVGNIGKRKKENSSCKKKYGSKLVMT